MQDTANTANTTATDSTKTAPLNTSAAATNVDDFFSDLDGGVFERKLSVALSQVAAATIDNNKVGEVNISLKFDRIPGTNQVRCQHTLKFVRPTADGKAGEEEQRSTVLHVGRFGAISLAQPTLLGMPAVQGTL